MEQLEATLYDLKVLICGLLPLFVFTRKAKAPVLSTEAVQDLYFQSTEALFSLPHGNIFFCYYFVLLYVPELSIVIQNDSGSGSKSR